MSHVAAPDMPPQVAARPPGLSRDARALLDQQYSRVWEIRTPDVASTARLSEALSEIAQLQELGEDWDLDGARPIDPQAIQLASRVVRAVEEMAAVEGVNWQHPEIGPVPDGSVAVTWEGSRRDTLMVFRPGQASSLECVTQEEKEVGPIRQVVSEDEAVRLALWALSDR